MDIKIYINGEFNELKRSSTKVLDTLTQEELGWRPASGCNSMGLILFHIARSEDSMVHSKLMDKPQVWSTGNWYRTLNMPENETGSHYTLEQVNAFRVPDKKSILDYYAAVRASTLDVLNGLDPAEFDRPVQLPFGNFSAIGIFALIINHSAQHIGEISYLRGILRGMNK